MKKICSCRLAPICIWYSCVNTLFYYYFFHLQHYRFLTLGKKNHKQNFSESFNLPSKFFLNIFFLQYLSLLLTYISTIIYSSNSFPFPKNSPIFQDATALAPSPTVVAKVRTTHLSGRARTPVPPPHSPLPSPSVRWMPPFLGSYFLVKLGGVAWVSGPAQLLVTFFSFFLNRGTINMYPAASRSSVVVTFSPVSQIAPPQNDPIGSFCVKASSHARMKNKKTRPKLT